MSNLFCIISKGALLLNLLLVICICLASGCRNPKVLRKRGYIPDPFPEPIAPAAAEPVKTQIEEKTIIKETIIDEAPVLVEATQKQAPVIPPFPKFEAKKITHKVQKNESFWTIARKYKVSTKELMAYNNYTSKKRLNAGTILTIPPGVIAPKDAQLNVSQPKPKPKLKKITIKHKKRRITKTLTPGSGKHVVKAGESLWSISKLYKINNFIALAKLNNLDIKKPLYEGQVLILPQGVKGNMGSATPKSKKKKRKAPKAQKVKTPSKPTPAKPIKEEKVEQPTPPVKIDEPAEPKQPEKSKDDNFGLGSDADLLKSIDKEADTPQKEDAETSKLIENLSKDDGFPEEDESLDNEVNELLKGSNKTSSNQPYGEHEVVRNGETLEDIAALYGSSLKVLIQLNPKITPKTKLKEGTIVKIP